MIKFIRNLFKPQTPSIHDYRMAAAREVISAGHAREARKRAEYEKFLHERSNEILMDKGWTELWDKNPRRYNELKEIMSERPRR